LAHSIPQAGYLLPLIDEPWLLPGQHKTGICLCEYSILEISGIRADRDHTLCVMECAGSLAAVLDTLDADSTKEPEVVLDLFVDESAMVEFVFHHLASDATVAYSIRFGEFIPSYFGNIAIIHHTH